MITHEFVLCSQLPKTIRYSDFPKSNLVAISDDFIVNSHIPFGKVKMHCQYLGNVICGLAYHGITIIPPDVATELKKELLGHCQNSHDLNALMGILEKAITNQHYVIHFGV